MMSMVKGEIVKRLVLDIGGREIELSLDEARQLCDGLNELLGKGNGLTITYPYPQPAWPQPHIWISAGQSISPLKTDISCY